MGLIFPELLQKESWGSLAEAEGRLIGAGGGGTSKRRILRSSQSRGDSKLERSSQAAGCTDCQGRRSQSSPALSTSSRTSPNSRRRTAPHLRQPGPPVGVRRLPASSAPSPRTAPSGASLRGGPPARLPRPPPAPPLQQYGIQLGEAGKQPERDRRGSHPCSRRSEARSLGPGARAGPWGSRRRARRPARLTPARRGGRRGYLWRSWKCLYHGIDLYDGKP